MRRCLSVFAVRAPCALSSYPPADSTLEPLSPTSIRQVTQILGGVAFKSVANARRRLRHPGARQPAASRASSLAATNRYRMPVVHLTARIGKGSYIADRGSCATLALQRMLTPQSLKRLLTRSKGCLAKQSRSAETKPQLSTRANSYSSWASIARSIPCRWAFSCVPKLRRHGPC
jgi:hypothetical protein